MTKPVVQNDNRCREVLTESSLDILNSYINAVNNISDVMIADNLKREAEVHVYRDAFDGIIDLHSKLTLLNCSPNLVSSSIEATHLLTMKHNEWLERIATPWERLSDNVGSLIGEIAGLSSLSYLLTLGNGHNIVQAGKTVLIKPLPLAQVPIVALAILGIWVGSAGLCYLIDSTTDLKEISKSSFKLTKA